MTEARYFITSKWTTGLILGSHGIHVAKLPACSFEIQPKINLLKTDKLRVKLIFSTKRKNTFLLKNHVDPNITNLEQIALVSSIENGFNLLKNSSINESPVDDVYIEVQNSRVILDFKIETARPSERLTDDMKKALEHHNPHQELIEIFKFYGYFLPRKIILGNKLYRISHSTEKNSTEQRSDQTEYMVFDEFLLKSKGILNHWESCMKSHNFDASYLLSTNGKIVTKSNLNNFISSWSTNDVDIDSLEVVDWNELYPLYKIFDNTLQKEIENILGIDDRSKISGIKEKVLMAGVISVNDSVCCYRVSFPYLLESNDYQIFGNLVAQNERSIKPIDQAIIKFENMNMHGFSVKIENFNDIRESIFSCLQITWILIGKPSKVGFYSKSTRSISLLDLGHTSFKPKKGNWNGRLEIKGDLPTDSILVTSFKCLQQPNCVPTFVANIRSFYKDRNEINITVTESKYSNNNLEQEFEYLLEWCIILPGHQEIKSANDNLIPIVTMAHLKSTGQNIYTCSQFSDTNSLLDFSSLPSTNKELVDDSKTFNLQNASDDYNSDYIDNKGLSAHSSARSSTHTISQYDTSPLDTRQLEDHTTSLHPNAKNDNEEVPKGNNSPAVSNEDPTSFSSTHPISQYDIDVKQLEEHLDSKHSPTKIKNVVKEGNNSPVNSDSEY
ncbi:1335_t:CDS:2, partial [Dentiscutata erythropus]